MSEKVFARLQKKSAIFFLTLFIPRLLYAILLNMGRPYKAGHIVTKRKKNVYDKYYTVDEVESFFDFYLPRVFVSFCIAIFFLLFWIFSLYFIYAVAFIALVAIIIDLVMMGCRALYVHDAMKSMDKTVPVRLDDLWRDQHEKEKESSKADEYRENKRNTGDFGVQTATTV